MAKLAQIAPLLHHTRKALGGRIRRAIIDVDDLIGPAAVERDRDFPDQWRDVVSLVAHGDDNGNGDFWCGNRQDWSSSNGTYGVRFLWGRNAPGNPQGWLKAGQFCRRREWQSRVGARQTSIALPWRRAHRSTHRRRRRLGDAPATRGGLPRSLARRPASKAAPAATPRRQQRQARSR